MLGKIVNEKLVDFLLARKLELRIAEEFRRKIDLAQEYTKKELQDLLNSVRNDIKNGRG